MKVFITIPWFFPAFRAGGPIQSIANMVNNYSEDIEYRIFCGATDLNGEHLPVKKGEWVPYNDHTMVWYAEDKISHTLTEQAEAYKPDILFIVGLFSWHFNIVPMFFTKANKKIISVRGMLHAGALSQKKIKKKLFLLFLEASAISDGVSFHATDDAEKLFIEKAFGSDATVFVAENFGRKMNLLLPLHKEPGSLKLITVALISPMKNYLTVLEALAHVDGKVEYNIYGPVKDQSYWDRCLAVINKLPPSVTVIYHGETDPAMLEKILSESHLFIMPSLSENYGHAIYEALSAGRPVITSHNTPWNNLKENTGGENTDTTVVAIAEAIKLFTKMDNDTYVAYATGAQNYILSKVNQQNIRSQYDAMFTKTV